jgi:type IV pilus assembly protein PilX
MANAPFLPRSNCGFQRRGQQGMTLLVGLILLAMLTVLSTIGYRNSTMSERMTGNAVDRNVAFQSAESAGNQILPSIHNGTAAALTIGYYATPMSQGGTTTFWTEGDGATVSSPTPTNCAATAPFSWKSCAASVADKYTNNANNTKYVIEKLSGTGTAVDSVHVYRVTTRSKGGSDNADVILQIIEHCVVKTTPTAIPCS